MAVFDLSLVLLSSDALASKPMGQIHARILLNRAGFGATRLAIHRFATLSRSAAVRRLIDSARDTAITSRPDWTSHFDSPRDLSHTERNAWRKRERGMTLRA